MLIMSINIYFNYMYFTFNIIKHIYNIQQITYNIYYIYNNLHNYHCLNKSLKYTT